MYNTGNNNHLRHSTQSNYKSQSRACIAHMFYVDNNKFIWNSSSVGEGHGGFQTKTNITSLVEVDPSIIYGLICLNVWNVFWEACFNGGSYPGFQISTKITNVVEVYLSTICAVSVKIFGTSAIHNDWPWDLFWNSDKHQGFQLCKVPQFCQLWFKLALWFQKILKIRLLWKW